MPTLLSHRCISPQDSSNFIKPLIFGLTHCTSGKLAFHHCKFVTTNDDNKFGTEVVTAFYDNAFVTKSHGKYLCQRSCHDTLTWKKSCQLFVIDVVRSPN